MISVPRPEFGPFVGATAVALTIGFFMGLLAADALGIGS
jgi:hypothetical protein